ncbi:glycoside hydrolase family 99-like domain-containing protein [Dyadobacter sp. LHD-138]|uniref:glycoside hydrolase family 99-like domain-containing protein n=1 Tax=Dyadobacter sp. LHD-138 TaxID=3071413 RepID=UPI0027E1A9A3|nr:glycoside hydrolase family 99-like domain-containing protein [Dyadobacter sp. LHD-138]MDQ6481567.1 glycoside hydrolase family 99-like domain-containing protein [Dyadobacter sp. LHD-138]
MKEFKNIFIIFSFLLVFISTVEGQKKNQSFKLGAFYFDGWTGLTTHLTPKLQNDFPDRKPIWGWKTSTSQIMQKQIDVAASAGISFFDFCWYYQKGGNYENPAPLNNALNLYLKAPNKKKLNFTIMVANHPGFIFKADEWEQLSRYWCSLFKDPSYLLVDDKPIITFFSMQSLIETFGTPEKVNEAFKVFKNIAVKEGLNGVVIAGAVNSSLPIIKQAERCGFDVLTGYNYHGSGLNSIKNEIVSIDSMRIREQIIWNNITQTSTLPLIPVITLNWDHRPWDKSDTTYSPRFIGYSGISIKNAVAACKKWSKNNPSKIVNENIAILYAWNEYGEGAWLTPSRKLKNSLLQGVKAGLKEN